MPVDEELLKNLPTAPGVYLMVDRRGRVLYVGKAGNLRNRVRSYFVKGRDERPSIPYLVQRVDTIRTILTDTEKEALILENNLIKQHRPRYNVDLRDDKSFFSLRLNVSHQFPRLTLVRTLRVMPDGERYFGPYHSAMGARVTLKLIQRLFPLRQCTERHIATCKRPCLNCQMKRCLCPCRGACGPGRIPTNGGKRDPASRRQERRPCQKVEARDAIRRGKSQVRGSRAGCATCWLPYSVPWRRRTYLSFIRRTRTSSSSSPEGRASL